MVGVTFALPGSPGGLGPLESVRLRPLSDLAVLGARARQHRHEPPSARVDVTHLLARGELGVRDVEEVRAAGQLNEAIPGGDVRLIVGDVAVQQAVRERHRPVRCDGEREHELLEIGTVVLGVTERRRRGALAGALPAVGALVGAVQADRGGVVVQLRAVDLELGDHAEHQLHQQRRAIAVKELIQRAPDAIVVEHLALIRTEAEQSGVVALGPLGKAVERLARHAQVAHQQADRRGGRERDALIGRRQVAAEHALHSCPCEEQVDDRQRAEALRVKLEWWVVGHDRVRPLPTL